MFLFVIFNAIGNSNNNINRLNVIIASLISIKTIRLIKKIVLFSIIISYSVATYQSQSIAYVCVCVRWLAILRLIEMHDILFITGIYNVSPLQRGRKKRDKTNGRMHRKWPNE